MGWARNGVLWLAGDNLGVAMGGGSEAARVAGFEVARGGVV